MSEATGAIVVGVDGSDAALRAVRWAAAEAVPRKLRLYLVCATAPTFGYYGPGLPVPQSLFDDLEAAQRTWLSAAAKAAHEVSESLAVSTARVSLPPIPALLDIAATARMIVLGASGRGGFTGMLAGSTAVAVAAHARCPVVVVRTRLDGSVPIRGPVVVGVDGSPTSERALGAAFDEASWRGAPLVPVHAWSDVDYATELTGQHGMIGDEPHAREQRRVLAESLAGWREKYPDVRVDEVVVRDRPRQRLLDHSASAQLVVVGSRGRGGFTGMLLGSTSQALVYHAQCPVMIVRPERGE